MQKVIPKLKLLRSTEIKTGKSPEEFYESFCNKNYSALLCGKGENDNSRYAFIGLNPFYKIQDTGKDTFEAIQQTIDRFSVKDYSYPENLWGGIGYISYEAAHDIEALPKTTRDQMKMPKYVMVYYQDMLIFDQHKKKVFLVQAKINDDDFTNTNEILESENQVLTFVVEDPVNCCKKEKYVEKVKKIQDYIVKGDVYEVNMSHTCQVPYEGSEFGIFKKLYGINPSPFSAYLPFGDYKIISNSPERFLLVEGQMIETRPIKGTLPRSDDKEQDERNKVALLSSEKEEAELSMIVDLLRNDLGKVSEYGSVKVVDHKRLEKFKNVWHMISIIKSKLRKECQYGDLLRACFPGGSITGCPKIRSMEIIDEMEENSRNIYTGTIFIANDMRIDSSIVIRTVIAHKEMLYFNIGGAIIYDSDPEKEYEETRHKAGSILKALS